MKNTYITIVVLIILVAGGVLVLGTSKKAEAPAREEPISAGTENTSGSPTVADAPSTIKEFTITSKNFSFTPALITVKKGERVKITFENSAGFHDFKIDEYGLATKKTQSPTTEVLEFTADKVGSFEYYCSVGSHRATGMKGTLKVTE